jgi:hypothetical protein
VAAALLLPVALEARAAAARLAAVQPHQSRTRLARMSRRPLWRAAVGAAAMISGRGAHYRPSALVQPAAAQELACCRA